MNVEFLNRADRAGRKKYPFRGCAMMDGWEGSARRWVTRFDAVRGIDMRMLCWGLAGGSCADRSGPGDMMSRIAVLQLLKSEEMSGKRIVFSNRLFSLPYLCADCGLRGLVDICGEAYACQHTLLFGKIRHLRR